MAILSTAVFEMRAAGTQYGGAGFDTGIAGYGTDYTQQTAPQLSLTDLVCTAASTTVTSVTGGFTTAMIGNAICIASGTNFVPGYYFITARNSNNSITVDRTPVSGNGSAGVGNVGGAASAAAVALLCAQMAAGNTIWMQNGNYVLSADLNLIAGSASLLTKLFGYNVTRGDIPILGNRPRVTGGYSIVMNDDCSVENLDISTTGANGCIYMVGINSVVTNCKCTQTLNGTVYCIKGGSSANNTVIGCELYGNVLGSNAIGITNTSTLVGCYIHDLGTGATGCTKIINCVLANCSIRGVLVGQYGVVVDSTLYNCHYAIDTTSTDVAAINNIIHSAGVGINATTYISPMRNNYNCMYNNAINFLGGIVAGPNDLVNINPMLANPASADYTLMVGSPCLGAGRSAGLLTGLGQPYVWNIGADQGDHPTPTGGTDFAHWGI